MITKKVFDDLAIYMIGFGVVVGVIFPFFVNAVGVPASLVLTPLFFVLCIAAGFIVGWINIFLARKIVGRKLKQLSFHMKYIESHLINRTVYQNTDECGGEKCFLKIDSEDEIGESAQAFNALVKSLLHAFQSEIAIRTFTEMLSSRLELDELAQEAQNRLMTIFSAEGAAIIIEKEGELSILSSYGIKAPESILNSDMVWKVVKTQKRKVIRLPEDIILNGLLVDFRPKSIMIEPITYKDIILGVVILAGVNEFNEEMQSSLELFGHGLALAFRNAIMHDQLQKLAANDPLTGIFNRRFGLSRLKDEFARAIRSSTPLGILIFDIDHFKYINDTYGHIVGDKVLIKLTKAAKFALREGDVFLRYGGEEFLVILPGASIVDVFQISERLRHIIEDTEIQHNSQIIKITISIGGTSFPEHEATDTNTLISKADKNLYRAKESGRNKSIID